MAEIEDFNSKYTGAEVEAKLDKIDELDNIYVQKESILQPPTLTDDYVDLGLPSGNLWYNRYIGQTTSFSSDYKYFNWGGTVPVTSASEINVNATLAEDIAQGVCSANGELTPAYDVAQIMGLGCIPTPEDVAELLAYTEDDSYDTSYYSDYHRRKSKVNGNWIYLRNVGGIGYSTRETVAFMVNKRIDDTNMLMYRDGTRNQAVAGTACPVRPVKKKELKFYTKSEVDALLENAGGLQIQIIRH